MVGYPDAYAGARSRPRPVLMIPLRRCGSHALRLRLNLSPEFFSPYPLHVIDFVPLLPLYGDLSVDRNYFRLVVDIVGFQASSTVKWPGVAFDPVEIFEAIHREQRSVHRIVWELLLRSGAQRSARVVMDKSLDSVRFADELVELVPDLLFLNVVRDPRAQVASMNRAIIHDFDSALNACSWVEAHRMARSLGERFPDRVLTVRYEDFLFDQERTLRAICRFLGIEYLPDMLDVGRSREAQDIAKRSALWASNCFAPIPAYSDKFKSELDLQEIEIIESVAREYMLLYGYDLMTEARRVPDAAMLEACHRRSESARQRAWRELEARDYQDYVLRRFRADYLDRLKRGLQRESIRRSISIRDGYEPPLERLVPRVRRG